MKRREFLARAGAGGAAALAAMAGHRAAAQGERPPNIVYILADDLGIGDPGCYNPESKIPTPHMDRIAREGMRFTDAHAGAAVCTPTRYGILTGRYSWRSVLKSGAINGYGGPVMDLDQLTVAELLGDAGYHTACIGKWHLGWDWTTTDGEAANATNIDYGPPFKHAPTAHGFDYFFGIPASLDFTPYVYIENDKVVEAATATTRGRPRGLDFWRGGPMAPGFDHAAVLPELTEKAVAVVERHGKQRSARPLFLYFPLPAPHTPILPTGEFEGVSGTHAYGDFTAQVDASIGAVIEALERHNMLDDTLLIVTSDNGCAPMADMEAMARDGHHPSMHWRGHKADIYEGGHRVPFLVRWPRHVAGGSTYEHPVCLTDLMATAAALAGKPLPPDAGVDSVNLLPALRGERGPVREAVVHQSANGSLAIRRGDWKLILCPGSGGWSEPVPGKARTMDLPPVQLYNLREDPGETRNLEAEHPDTVTELKALLQDYIDRGRSTPGPAQTNEGETTLWGPLGPPPNARQHTPES